MPAATYEELLVETVPKVTQPEKQYRGIGNRFGELAGKGRARSQDEAKLMRLLALLIEDYDRRNAMPPNKATPAERLAPAGALRQDARRPASDLRPA